MLDTDLARMDAVAQSEAVRRGEISALELVDSAIERITAGNPTINAVIYERFDQARDEARASRRDTRLSGVPLLLKDLGCPAEGQPDHQGSVVLKDRDNRADHDCSIVRRFRSAGFIVLGRTNVPEFGLVSDTTNKAYGATRNPWNTKHTPGGSSGGSGAAVASGMVAVAHGNDGGGSIRLPASHCGLVGLKPSRGRVSHAPDAGDPMFGHVSSGVLTRSVRDTATILEILAGNEPGDPCVPPGPHAPFLEALKREPTRLRIGCVSQPSGPKWTTHEACVRAVDTAATVLRELGHEVTNSFPEALFEDLYWSKWFDALSPTVTSVVDWAKSLAPGEPAEFDPITWLWADRGRALSAESLAQTLDWMDGYRRRMASWWTSGHDLLLCPAFLTPPPVVGSFWSYPEGIRDSVDILQFTPQFNTTGQPAISIPMIWTEDNLPVGVQLVAAYGQEELLISVAAQIERVRPWAWRYPAKSESVTVGV